MSRAEEAREIIRSTIERQIKLAELAIDAARTRIQHSEDNIAGQRVAIKREEAMIREWRQLLDSREETP